jgi:acetyl-CoA synthetase
MISPASGIELTPLKPGSATLPLPGVNADIVDDKGQSVPQGSKGYLVIKSPWPGMLQTIWKDPDRFKAIYFGKWPGIYYVGDYAIRDPDEYFWLLGRADEVLKVAGHRIGTVELEIIKHVRTTIGPIATPDAVVIVAKLPKTRSGKIMRRLLKAVLTGAPLGDTSTIEDEGSIEDIKATYNDLRKQLGSK